VLLAHLDHPGDRGVERISHANHSDAGRPGRLQRTRQWPNTLLLHATLHDSHDFDPIRQPLARHYRTIAVDWPGHGESDPPDVPAGAPLFADVLEDVVDGLGISRAVLIGNSVGGFAAARLALNRPALVAGLVLVNTGGFVPQNLLSRTACRMLGTPAVFRRLAPVFVRGYMNPRPTVTARSPSVRAPWRRRKRGSRPVRRFGAVSPHPHTICADVPPS
jgi:pimeloyl-ACP methyl ester carboxylesterase